MQTQSQNEDAKNLVERLKADLAQPQPKPEDGKPLANVQIQIEVDSLRAIEDRAALRKAAGQGVDAVTDKQLVEADLQAFSRIGNLALQESAAVSIADNARAFPAYKQVLEKGLPPYPGAAAQIAALDAANTERVNAREEAKWIEVQGTLLEREARAKKWTQDDAQKQAQADSQAFQKAQDRAERYTLLEEIKFNAKANLAYKASLEATAPAIAARISAEKQPVEKVRKQPEMVLDPLALSRVAELRKRDSEKVREAFEGNSIELSRKKEIKPEEEAQTKRPAPAPAANKVESDEIFTAGKPDARPIVPAEIEKNFHRVGDRFYHPKNKELVAFEDKGNRLETKSNSENIAFTLVRIAEARGWDEIKVSGSDVFRREVWIVAAARSMHVKGYTPTEQDKAELAQRLGRVDANKIEPENKPAQLAPEKPSAPDKPDKAAVAPAAPDKKIDSPKKALMFDQMAKAFKSQTPEEATKNFPALASAAAALKIVEKKAEADGLNAEQRAIITARARENIAGKIERGNMPKFSVNEKIQVNRDRAQDRVQEL